jgi:hypothetical protein
MPEQMRYAERLSAGLCTACGGKLGRGRRGLTKCAACAGTISAADQARKERLAAAGLCVKCGAAPAQEGRLRCVACLTYHAQRMTQDK